MRCGFLLVTLVASAITAGAAEEPFYLGTYTGHSGSQGIYAGSIDPSSGRLGPLTLAATAADPSFLALRPDGRTLYAAEETSGEGAVESWRRDAGGRLKPLNRVAAGGNGTCFVSVDATGRNALVANYGSGSYACLRLKPDGSLGEQSGLMKFDGSGPNKLRQEGSHAHAIYPGPDNAFLYACDLGTDCVWVIRFDPAAGKMVLSYPPAAQTQPGDGPRHLVFSHDGKWVYVASELGQTVTVYSREASTGDLTRIQEISTLPPGDTNEKAAPAEIILHPNGKWLYVSNRLNDTIAFFSVGPAGRLRLEQDAPASVKTPRSIALDPSGKWLVAAGQDDDRLAVLKIDRATGKLAKTSQTAEAPAPVCVLFEPAF